MSEHMGCLYNPARAKFGAALLCRLFAEECHTRANIARVGVVGGKRGLDAEHGMPAVVKIGEQSAIVGTDIDAEIIGPERKHISAVAVEIGEIVAQDAC